MSATGVSKSEQIENQARDQIVVEHLPLVRAIAVRVPWLSGEKRQLRL